MKNIHDPEAPVPVPRDPYTITGIYMAVTDARRAKKAGKELRRPYDRPVWAALLGFAGKSILQILTAAAIFGIAAWANSCGVHVPRMLLP